MAALRALGARSVPVVARDGKFVYAQVIKDVVDFLGLKDETGPQLAPLELGARGRLVLDCALRLTRQMPDAALERQLPNRPRSWRVLVHHVFQIWAAFLDSDTTRQSMTYEAMVAEPEAAMHNSAAIAAFGENVSKQLDAWWQRARIERFDVTVTAYFGTTTRHELLERTVWHSAQHVRQIASLLESLGIAPDQPLDAAAIRGLPLTEKIWDELPA
jgi:uncharacterized damage-inducible protein DinB